jgi:hypothetical protein
VSEQALTAIRDLIQEDIGKRGLATDSPRNLLTACPNDFAAACRSIAGSPRPTVAVVTGFYIPHARPPCGETDGPLGAIFLARALGSLGILAALVTDEFCAHALRAGLNSCGLPHVPVLTLDSSPVHPDYWRQFSDPFTHLIALERVGPSHTLESLQGQMGPEGALGETYLDFLHEVPPEHQDRCHTMRGLDITAHMSPAHLLFEAAARKNPRITTIGIGDGGNEIGMGKIPWDIIHRNIPGGGLVACRVPTDHLIVCGISNWGAYGVGAGVRLLRGQTGGDQLVAESTRRLLFDPINECRILKAMVQQGPLVDGVTGMPTITVDGIAFDRYVEKLKRIGFIVSRSETPGAKR